MSTDIIACKNIIKYLYNINTNEEIASFTFSSRLNDYDEIYNLFINNYAGILTEKDDDAVFDIYIFSRNRILKMKKINDEKNFGDDVTWFLDKLLSSDVEIFYIKIF